MPILFGSVHAHILTRPSRAGFAVSRLELIEPGAATCVWRHGWAVFEKLGTYVPGTSTSIMYHNVFFLFWKKFCRARPQPTTLSTGRPTVSLRDMLQVTLLLCQARSYGSQTGVGLPLLQCWVPLSVCFSSVLAWMGLSVARNKEACPISYHIPCSSWYHHTVQFFRLQKLNRKFAHCCIR